MSMVAHGGAPNDSLLTRFPVYQIDFSAVASGKRIATTKRRIRWRFGFTNPDALADGQTGTACRGEEHDVTIVWSITSGKRQITMDGKEVHYSASRGGLLDFSWSVRGNHVLKVVCHASPPLSATPGFRQYDLFIDGQSFFSMPKVYELGIRGGPTSPTGGGGPRYAGAPDYATGGGGYSNYDLPRGGGSSYGGGGMSSAAPRSASQEEADLKRAIAESLEESRRYLGSGSSGRDLSSSGGGGPPMESAPKENGTADLLDFSNETPALPAPPAPTQDSQTIVSYGQATSAYPGAPPPAATSSYDAMSMTSAPPAYGAPPPPAQQQPQYTQPQIQNGAPPQQFAPAAVDQFAPAPTPYAPLDQFMPQPDDPFAPKPPPPPTRDDVNSAILGAYGTPGQAQNGIANGGYGPPAGYETPLASGMPLEAPPQQQAGDAPQLSMNAAFEEKEEPKSELEEAMSKLVNFDHIDEPAEKEIKLTMAREEEKKKKSKTSALPPAGTGYLGSNATLSQIKEVKPETRKKDPSEIMTPPPMLFSPGAVNAGALVVHGEGPPPLQRGFGVGQGFGVGAQMQYQQQMAQQYAAQQQAQQQYYGQQQPPPPQQQYYQNY